MMKFKERIIAIERTLEEQAVLLGGMQKVLEDKGSHIPKKEMLGIVSEMQKILDENRHYENF